MGGCSSKDKTVEGCVKHFLSLSLAHSPLNERNFLFDELRRTKKQEYFLNVFVREYDIVQSLGKFLKAFFYQLPVKFCFIGQIARATL